MWLCQNTIKEWRGKQIREIARDLASVQNKLHAEKEFPAVRELHGLIEMIEVAKEITSVNPSAVPWMKKAVDDAIEVALCRGLLELLNEAIGRLHGRWGTPMGTAEKANNRK